MVGSLNGGEPIKHGDNRPITTGTKMKPGDAGALSGQSDGCRRTQYPFVL